MMFFPKNSDEKKTQNCPKKNRNQFGKSFEMVRQAVCVEVWRFNLNHHESYCDRKDRVAKQRNTFKLKFHSKLGLIEQIYVNFKTSLQFKKITLY